MGVATVPHLPYHHHSTTDRCDITLFPIRSLEEFVHRLYQHVGRGQKESLGGSSRRLDGRWNAQKKRMYAGQMVFGDDNCRMVYPIIEGIENQQMVNGGYLGARWFNVDKESGKRKS